MAAARRHGDARHMLPRVLPLIAALAALSGAADASARVTAGVSNRVLVVEGTVLRDQIKLTQAGATLNVSDKDRVDPGAGCGHAGDDVACALSGIDRISINALGSDDLVQIAAPVSFLATVHGGNGDDELSTNTTANGTLLAGDDGNDSLQSGPNQDVLEGGDGNDSLNGLGGDDHLDGGPGADTLHGGLQDDELVGDTGPDVVIGDGGLDTAGYTAAPGVTARLGGTTTGNGSS